MRRIFLVLLMIVLLCSCTDDESSKYNDENIINELNTLSSEIKELRTEVKRLEKQLSESESASEEIDIKAMQTNLEQLENSVVEFPWVKVHETAITVIDHQFSIDLMWAQINNANLGFEVSSGWVTLGDDDRVLINDIEWIYPDEIDKINDLGLDSESDFPSGFYLFDDVEKFEEIQLDNEVVYYVLDRTQLPKRTDIQGFALQIKGIYNNKLCVDVISANEKVIAVYQRYLP